MVPRVVTGAMWPYPMVVRIVVVKNTDWMKSQFWVKSWSTTLIPAVSNSSYTFG